ncbi:MAG: GreA/GreB family elongation factor, partial [Oscillospiraceae bacterium]|nr:GreA/GreB family elongation factor [Oscillospiraceae bacterium]
MLEAKIAETQYILDNAEIVENTGEELEEIDIGVVMTIRKVGSDKTEQLKIVGTNEANFLEHKISDESPIGKAAMKKRIGDTFIVEAPAGEIKYEVIDIAREIQKEV